MILQSRQFFTLAAFFSIAGVAVAHTGATGIVKERMMAMKSVAASTKALSRLDWNDAKAARDLAVREAGNIAEHADEIVSLFPVGSTQHPTEAGARIWSESERFEEIAMELAASARLVERLAPTASGQADIAAPMARLTATCKSCHADFRVKR